MPNNRLGITLTPFHRGPVPSPIRCSPCNAVIQTGTHVLVVTKPLHKPYQILARNVTCKCKRNYTSPWLFPTEDHASARAELIMGQSKKLGEFLRFFETPEGILMRCDVSLNSVSARRWGIPDETIEELATKND